MYSYLQSSWQYQQCAVGWSFIAIHRAYPAFLFWSDKKQQINTMKIKLYLLNASGEFLHDMGTKGSFLFSQKSGIASFPEPNTSKSSPQHPILFLSDTF